MKIAIVGVKLANTEVKVQLTHTKTLPLSNVGFGLEFLFYGF